MHYDPFSLKIQQDPFPVYEWLRDEAPLYHDEKNDFWVLSRYEDVQATLRNTSVFLNCHGVDVDKTDTLLTPGNMAEKDGADHDDLRRAVQPWFSPKSIRQNLEDPSREETARMVEGFLGREEIDITHELAFMLPTFVVAKMFDLPEDERPYLRSLMAPVFARLPDDPEPPPEALEAGRKIGDYFAEVVRRRREGWVDRGESDLLAFMLRAEMRGEPLPPELLIGTVAHFFLASSGTTQDSISNTILLLARYPEERRKLIEDPSLIPGAVEECLRFETVIQNTTRLCSEDFELHGVTIPKGATVVCLMGSANRDPRYWEDPERFDVSRTPRRQLGFADGPHHCIGAPIARFEVRLCVEEMLRLMPDFRVSRPPKRAVSHVSRGFEHVWIDPNVKTAVAA